MLIWRLVDLFMGLKRLIVEEHDLKSAPRQCIRIPHHLEFPSSPSKQRILVKMMTVMVISIIVVVFVGVVIIIIIILRGLQ